MKTDAPVEKPEQLRPIIHQHIDKLPVDDLPLVHRVLLQVEAERLAEQIAIDLGKEPEFFDKIEETISEFRKQNPYR